MKKIVYIILSVIVAVLFFGCGGGGGGGDRIVSSSSSTTLNGTSADGYISDSKVCLDINLNGLCDINEKVTNTDSLGKFQFDSISNSLICVISDGGFDTAVKKDFKKRLRKIISVDLNLRNNSFIISPLSDLVSMVFQDSNEKTSSNLSNIERDIASSLGITVDELNSDPMSNRDIFAISQKLAQTRSLIESVGVRSDSVTKVLADEIYETKNSDINITWIFNRLNFNISTDKINYIQSFIDDLDNSLSNISNDITLFSKYQMLIDDAMYQTSNRLYDNNLTLPVDIDLSESRVNSALPVVINPIADILLDMNSTSLTVDLTNVFTDSDDDDSNITKIVLSNSNESLVSASIEGNNLNLTFDTSVYGFSIITVRATSNGLSVNDTFTVSNVDADNDYIPDDIEEYLGMNPNSDDEDGDGEIDGLESSTSSISDQFFDKQWHIRSLGTQVNPYEASLTIEGNDLNLTDIYHYYMGYNNGDPIVIQIVDTGVDSNHEDLKDNVDLTLSRDSSIPAMGAPVETGIHGTMCAGIAAARAFNGKGVRGVAPFAKIAGSNWLGYQSASELEEVWTKNDPNGKIAVSSNSWGIGYADSETLYEDLMKYGAENLRIVNGEAKGKLFVKAAGNYRDIRHDSGLSYAASNPYVITVAGLENNNTYASYSSPGSNLFISAYSGNYYNDSPTIGTTIVSGTEDDSLPTWDEDVNHNYTYAMNGTSAATPMVAGALALVLEACPDLGWRDVKYLMAKNAIKIDSFNSSWVTNGAGFHHSVDYGFGLINTKAMINECKNSYISLPSGGTFTESFDPTDIDIPDNDTNGISYTFNINEDKTIEWIGVTVYSNHTNPSDLEIYLTSPSGTTTRLMLGNNSGCLGNRCDNYDMSTGFRYGSVAFYGERSSGEWTLKIEDIVADNNGSLQSIDFEVFGY